jgi:hypothetical protein
VACRPAAQPGELRQRDVQRREVHGNGGYDRTVPAWGKQTRGRMSERRREKSKIQVNKKDKRVHT